MNVLSDIPDGRFDLALLDPPYNVGKDYGGHNDEMPIDEYAKWCRTWFAELQRICKCILITPSRGKMSMWISEVAAPYDILCWYKPNSCTNGHASKLMVWEPIFVYGKPYKRPSHDFYHVSISVQRGVGNHPCPKSLKLFKKILLDFTNEGDKIIDPFLGSGTTAVAAKYLGRKCLGIEKNKDYCEISKLRLQQDLLNLGFEEE